MEKQNKIVKQLDREIASIEHKINHPKVTNFNNKSIRNLCIGTKIIGATIPYVLSATLIGFTFSALNMTPIAVDERKSKAYTRSLIDSEDTIITEKQYTPYLFLSSSLNQMFYCDSWLLNADGTFSRNVSVYNIDSDKLANAMKFLDTQEMNIEDILGNPVRTYIETRNKLSSEEIIEKPYIQVILYDKDENDVIVRKETVSENAWTTLLYIFTSVIFSMTVVKDVKKKFFPSDLIEDIRRIKDEYELTSQTELEKKLTIKKANYKRLMR